MIDFLEEYPIFFDFSLERWNDFDNNFRQLEKVEYCFLGSEVVSCIRQSALMQFRIAIILNALRQFEDYKNHGVLPNPAQKTICNSTDYHSSKSLIKVYIQHAICVLEKLPKPEGGLLLAQMSNVKKMFFKDLPETFDFQEVQKMAAN